MPEMSPTGMHYARPSEFLKAGRAARGAELAFMSVILLWNVGVITGIVALVMTGVLWQAGPLAVMLAPALLIFSGWIALSAQAYLRWMVRNWRV